MNPYFSKLFRYTAWADRKLLDALREFPEAQAEGLPLFAHVLGSEHVWLSRIHGRGASITSFPELTIDECDDVLTTNIHGYAILIAAIDDESEAQRIRYRNKDDMEFETPLGEILTHVVTHGAYHRGQVAKAIGRAAGQGSAPSTDYIVFSREFPDSISL